ncbi:hypothetical protein [Tritonibacter mobilis]|nr:hypothetical protein [Tritonibacter mobilis]MBU3035769.1 hypothetical protein [Tritonibacter mobilis]WHQ81349.1 hypothetical protein OMR53_09040 [Tritonibacter mobilis]
MRITSVVAAGILGLILTACTATDQPTRNAFSEPLTYIAPAIAPFPG